jgi:hypothetical protein
VAVLKPVAARDPRPHQSKDVFRHEAQGNNTPVRLSIRASRGAGTFGSDTALVLDVEQGAARDQIGSSHPLR